MAESHRSTETSARRALQAHYEKTRHPHRRQFFGEDSNRADRFSIEGADLYLDDSKNRITDKTIRLLLHLAKERGVAERRDAMFRSEKINATEKRAVLHVAPRAPRGAQIKVDGVDVMPESACRAPEDGGLFGPSAQR